MSAKTSEVEKDLAVVENKPLPIKFSKTKAAIGKMATKYKTVPDVTTPEGYAIAQQAKRDLTPMRTAVVAEMKKQKESAQTHIANINKKGNELIDLIVAIEEPIYEAKKLQDAEVARKAQEEIDKEDRRIAEIETRVEEIKNLTEGLLGADLEAIKERLAEARAIKITDDVYMEFVEAASTLLAQVKAQLDLAVTNQEALDAQQAEINTQQEGIAAQQRENDLKASVQRIKMAPVDLIGGAVSDMEVAVDKLSGIDVIGIYGDLADEATEAINETKEKLKGMIAQQKGLDDQQAEIDRKQKEQDDREEEEALQIAADEKQEIEEKEAAEKADELKARLPEDQKLRAYADALVEVKVPDVEDPVLAAVARDALVNLSEVRTFIYENTQESE